MGYFPVATSLLKGVRLLTFFIFLIFFTFLLLLLYLLFLGGLCLFKGLCLLFLRNVPGAMFIQGGTSIPVFKSILLVIIIYIDITLFVFWLNSVCLLIRLVLLYFTCEIKTFYLILKNLKNIPKDTVEIQTRTKKMIT